MLVNDMINKDKKWDSRKKTRRDVQGNTEFFITKLKLNEISNDAWNLSAPKQIWIQKKFISLIWCNHKSNKKACALQVGLNEKSARFSEYAN